MKANGLLGILQDCLNNCNDYKSSVANFMQSVWVFLGICFILTTIPFFVLIVSWNFVAPSLFGFLNPNWLHVGFENGLSLYFLLMSLMFLCSVFTIKFDD